ncbi:MAG: HD-GYP domain-containing protein [Firmicutes bacterium]|nr:HD-GYP domain-containing protein [Bacillota bacterium]
MKKKVLLSEVNPGDKLGQDIFIGQSKLLVSRGTVISQRTLNRIHREGYQSLVIETEDLSEEAKPAAAAAEGGYSLEQLQSNLDQMRHNIAKTRYIVEEVMRGRPIPIDVAREVVSVVCDKVLNREDLYSDLMTLRSKDNYTFEHSLGVCIIGTTIARAARLPRKEFETLSLTSLMHDIGKLGIEDHILKKPGPLSREEYTAIKQHPLMGYRIVLRDLNNETIADSVLQHHENEDGSGYPYGLRGEKIHPYAKIIHIADTFDAIVANRAYSARRTPIKAFEEINLNIERYDYSIYQDFIKQFSQYYIGSLVTLNTGHEGYIMHIDSDNPGQPMIRVGEDIINLNKLRDVYITELKITKKHRASQAGPARQ